MAAAARHARPQAHGRPRRALQPGGRARSRELIARRAASAASSASRPRASARCRRASATPAWRSTSPPTTSTSCSSSLGRDITRVYAEGTRFSHPTQEDMLTCLLRFGDRRPVRPARRQLAHAREAARADRASARAACCTPSYITQDVWFTESPPTADRLGRAGAPARRRRGRGDPLRPAQGRAAARRARGVRRLHPRRHARAGRRAYDGCRALTAALAVRDSAAHNRPVTLLGMPSRRRPVRWPPDPGDRP